MFGHRRLRAREKRRYNEDANDDDLEGKRNFNLDEQITAERFNLDTDKYLKQLNGDAITLRYIQKNGFDKPILVKEPSGLNLRMPPETFSIKDIKNCVGSNRTIDVMDVQTQKDVEMSMRDWCKYYKSKNRVKLLNVISLEFSHTKLDQMVDSPMIVKLLDWVDLVWPQFLKQSQTESTNTINKMKYPKVQKYCLMSVKGSYTDFHIDFGGTSVWYHVLRGRKVFWMVPPTELNLTFYEEWILSGKQQDVFFGDTVEECFRIELEAGNTFFIPSGWIHAVYTPEDSLVFGGNFLHSYGIEKQLRVSQIEDVTKVPIKFRYPFYTEVLWYVLQHYVYCLTGKDHLIKQEELEDEEKQQTDEEGDVNDETEEEGDEKFKKIKGKKRRVRVSKKKGAAKKRKIDQKKPEDDGDKTEVEDTDIEDENEEKKLAIAIPTTCRMTKNSLLRLQYEVSPVENTSESKHLQVSSTSPTPPSANQKESKVANLTSSSDSNGLGSSSEQSKSNRWALSSTWTNTIDQKKTKKIYLTKYEINGLRVLVKYLSKLTGSKKNLPHLIKESKALIDDTKKMIADHENDDPDLAITGKPISHLALASNSADMNQLIGQFFRTKNELSSTEDEDPISDHDSQDEGSRGKKKSTEKKSNHNSSPQTSPSKSAIFKTQVSITATDSSSLPTSKHASPMKKEKTLPVSSESPPPRPPSPPTRPLSYNQYSAKTKNKSINDPLPGSFASLIAATSTERNSFDLSVSDNAAVPLPVSLSTDNLYKNSLARSSTSGSEGSSPIHRKNDQTSSSKWANLMNSKGDSIKKQPTDKSSSAVKAPNSPVPPKIPQPKPPTRFASLNQKPQSKEKLIFASTPYNSNAQGPQPIIQPNSIMNRPICPSPYATPYSTPMIAQKPPNSPYHRPPQHSERPPHHLERPPHHLVERPPHHLERPHNIHRMIHPPNSGPISQTKQTPPPSHQSSIQKKPSDLVGHQQVDIGSAQPAKKVQFNEISTTLPQQESPTKLESNIPSEASSVSARKPSEATIAAAIDAASSKNDDKGSSKQQTTSLPTNPQKSEPSTNKQQAKPKAKKVKKSEKPEERESNNDKSTSDKKEKKPRKSTKSKKVESSASRKGDSPSVQSTNIATISSSGISVPPNSFIMARPMMNLNTMGYPPQFQAINNPATMNVLARAGFPGFITPFPQQIGIPAMQNLGGTRFILAAPQARPNLTQNRQMVPAVRTEPDNTALLSLATTALSTTPQTSTYSNVGSRPSVTQAILVGATNAPNVYAGQHFFRPIVQPMINTSTGQVSSNEAQPRPMALQTNLGPLVLARLPNQAAPRFLITSPMIQQAYQLQQRPPMAHQQQVQAQSQLTNLPTTLSPSTSTDTKTQDQKSSKPAGAEPIYRQPPKKMARAMFIPSTSWNPLQTQHSTPQIAITTNSANKNSMSTSAISTVTVTTNSGLLAQPSTIPMTSTTKRNDKSMDRQESHLGSNNSDKPSSNSANKTSKRPAKARHKRGGHRCQTRRMRCSKCPSCVRSDCGSCDTCKNMSKFGGPGTQKQACLARQCTNPQLPRNVVCEICNIDGFTGFNNDSKNLSTLMECNTCYKIVHPQCFRKKRPDLIHIAAVVDTDFVNSWKCPGCVSGKSDFLNVGVKDLGSTPTSSCQQQTIASSSVPFGSGLPNTSKLSA